MDSPLILVVDDSPISRALIKRKLEARNLRIIEASDGAEGAVAAMREAPDIVITDLEMPIMDGFQLARLIKNDESTQGIRVIILTSHDQETSRFWGLQIGADAYITKEDIDDKLLSVVDNFLDLNPASKAARRDAPQDILQVLARVARQLDSGLMEATLSNQILQIGHGDKQLNTVAEQLLGLFSRLTRAHLLGLSFFDGQMLRIFLHRPAPSRIELNLQNLRDFVLSRMNKTAADLTEIRIEGDTEGTGSKIDIEAGRQIEFPLPKGRAFLLVWPFDAEVFDKQTSGLLEKSKPQLSLVIENALLSESLWRLSTIDGLTGLLNHRSIRKRLYEEFDRARRYKLPLTIGIADVDRFKKVNDTWGHLVGDGVLREIARTMSEGLRSSDILGRYGGEEFLILLPHSKLQDARGVCTRICEKLINHPLRCPELNQGLNVTASFGLAAMVEISGPDAAESLIALADSRLYQAKEEGRARVKPE